MNADVLRLPPLYPITDRRISGLSLLSQTRILLQSGFRVIQLREKTLPDKTLLIQARACVRLARAGGALCVINNRADIAALCGGAGLHLGHEDLPVKKARDLLGRKPIIGLSTHSADAALRAAENSAVSYIAIGPIYPTRTKPSGRKPLGPETIARVRRHTGKPIVAIGGITASRACEVWEAGADSAVFISAIWKGDFRRNARRFHAAWERHKRRTAA